MTAGTIALLAMPIAGLVLGMVVFGLARSSAQHDRSGDGRQLELPLHRKAV